MQDKLYIKELYYFYKKKSIKDLSNIINISETTLKKVLKNDFNINLKTKNRYTININYFEHIDTEEKAYILGFLASDGHVSNNYINFTSKDKDILEKIKECMDFSGEIRYGNKGNFEGSGNVYILVFSNEKMANNLRNLEITNNKSLTYNKIPNIPEDLKRHFLRGYFDGDGCVCAYQRKYLKKNKEYIYNRLHMDIIATEPFIKDIINTFKIEKYSIGKSKTPEMKYLNINAKKELKKMYDLMYKDSKISLNRKREIWENNIMSL